MIFSIWCVAFRKSTQNVQIGKRSLDIMWSPLRFLLVEGLLDTQILPFDCRVCDLWLFGRAFYVKAESLRKLGFASAARGARKQASHYRGGYWAAIKTNAKLKAIASFYGKMVRVVGVHTRVHLANVSASLDLEPHLDAPLQNDRTMRNPGGHVWHAAMIHHRCKMLTICDSACERYFSLLHSIFDEDRSLAPHRMANRLLLREASVSCLGGPGTRRSLTS